MSRARQVANFDPALFAADEVSGDKVSGGTIGAGTLGGTSIVNTSGAITTTGAFTSVGIDDNADANAITIDSSENVGIGGTPVDVVQAEGVITGQGGTKTPRLQVTGTSDTTTGLVLSRYSADVDPASLHFVKGRGTVGSSTTADTNDFAGAITFSCEDGTETPAMGAGIASTIVDTPSNGTAIMDMRFFTASASAPVERMRIDKNGNVGINHVTPGFKLQVNGTLAAGLSGTVSTYTNDVVWNSPNSEVKYKSSTERTKDNIRPVEIKTEDIYKFSVKNYEDKDGGANGVGLIAEEVNAINPEFSVLGYWDDENNVEIFGWLNNPELIEGVNTSPVNVDKDKVIFSMLVELQKLKEKVTALESA